MQVIFKVVHQLLFVVNVSRIAAFELRCCVVECKSEYVRESFSSPLRFSVQTKINVWTRTLVVVRSDNIN